MLERKYLFYKINIHVNTKKSKLYYEISLLIVSQMLRLCEKLLIPDLIIRLTPG